ncbi:hypothetical protein L228DRAFT_36837 [Xylona heveae TC161]|uniref:PRELI/MSF1 domain-containing protein n=1 Tax=Xylona heveae (strain CBS 132557 / TC161) TaxID=1328760 RepID=A0A164ZVT7_XYLHT|nr:hypothetical protein L228DRAFT_36837 [Xylona heveae TC161]KZF19594.1 hypothetical protein L228DRAFT_36837 [Xylona heveae TC161]
MVKVYENSFSYDYSFPAVALAYFLRYPNPYATHVISTDVIDRRFDAETQRLYTTRLHLKKSKLPPAVLKLLPKSILGNANDDSSQSYILETSIVDVKEGWMETESRNLEWTGILSVVERQMYRRPLGIIEVGSRDTSSGTASLIEHAKDTGTDVTASVTLLSRLGQGRFLKQRSKVIEEASSSSRVEEEEEQPKRGLFKSWSTASIQGSIELIGMRRTREALAKSKEGMNVVLDRLRQGGLVAVLEGMRRDREAAFQEGGLLRNALSKGRADSDEESPTVSFDPFDNE